MLQLFSKSVGHMIVMLAVSGCSTAPPYGSVEPGIDGFEPFELPLRMNEQGVATVVVGSSYGPPKLILDTGADQAILLRADALVIDALTKVGSEWKGSAGGQVRLSPVYVIPEVQLGTLRFGEVRATLEHAALPVFMPGDGVLGRGMLRGLTLDIDLPSGRLGILPAGTLPEDFEAHAWITVPLLDMQNGPVVSVRLDESESNLRMVLDTGAITTGPDGAYGIVELPSDLTPEPPMEDQPPVYRAKTVLIGDGSIGPMPFFVKAYPWPPDTEGFEVPHEWRRSGSRPRVC